MAHEPHGTMPASSLQGQCRVKRVPFGQDKFANAEPECRSEMNTVLV